MRVTDSTKLACILCKRKVLLVGSVFYQLMNMVSICTRHADTAFRDAIAPCYLSNLPKLGIMCITGGFPSLRHNDQDAFFDIRVFNSFASNYRNQTLPSLYRSNEKENKKEYGQRIQEVEHDSFTPHRVIIAYPSKRY